MQDFTRRVQVARSQIPNPNVTVKRRGQQTIACGIKQDPADLILVSNETVWRSKRFPGLQRIEVHFVFRIERGTGGYGHEIVKRAE